MGVGYNRLPGQARRLHALPGPLTFWLRDLLRCDTVPGDSEALQEASGPSLFKYLTPESKPDLLTTR